MEKVERILEMKPPSGTRNRYRWYWPVPVCFLVATFFAALSAISVDSRASMLFWLAQTWLNVTILSVYLGDGLYAGAFGRFGSGVRETGRKLRAFSAVSFLALPLYGAAFGGYFASTESHDYAAGALWGGIVGLVIVLSLVLWISYRYRRTGEDSTGRCSPKKTGPGALSVSC